MISCGGSSRGGHTAVVTEDGQLFAFGCGSQGQLGTGISKSALQMDYTLIE